MNKETKIFNWKQDFLYTTEQYKQLREQNLLVLRVLLCKIVVLNAHEPAEEKIDGTEDSFYEELEQFLSFS